MDLILKLANKFYKLASEYDKFRDRIELAARRNPKPFASWFSGGDRVYFPFQVEFEPDQDEQYVINFLTEKGYVVDWMSGTVEKGGRKERLGKVLIKLKETDPRLKDETEDLESIKESYNEMIKIYETSNLRKSKNKNLQVVISQNPHDIAQMSTGRGWTSCMNLAGEDEIKSNVYCEVGEGGLIAYLIEASDQNIQKPLARILIRRYVNNQGHSYAVAEDTIYGNAPLRFLSEVKKWLNEHQGFTKGTYSLTGSQHSDTLSSELLPNPENIEEEIIDLLAAGKSFPKTVNLYILENKDKFPPGLIEEVESEIFKDWKEFSWAKEYKKYLPGYLLSHPERLDEAIMELDRDSIKNLEEKISKIDPKVGDLIRTKMLQKLDKEIKKVHSESMTGEVFRKRLILTSKIDFAPANQFSNVVKEAIFFARTFLGESNLLAIVEHAVGQCHIRNIVDPDLILKLKPYIEKIWDKDPVKAFKDFMRFFSIARTEVAFMLPRLESLLSSVKENSKVHRLCQAIIQSIKEDRYINLSMLE